MNEILIYIILGVLYLVFKALEKVAKKNPAPKKKEENWSLEDAIRDLQGSSEEQPEVVPAPSETSDWSDGFTTYNDTENASPKASKPEYTAPIPPNVRQAPVPKPKPVHLSEKHTSIPKNPATIAEQLKNQRSAQTAILLSEILGKPKGVRGFPRSYLQRGA